MHIFLLFLTKGRGGETLEYPVLNGMLPSTPTPSGLRKPCRREGRKSVRAREDENIKKIRPRDSNAIYVNSEIMEACAGWAQDLLTSKPDGVPGLRMKVDASPQPCSTSCL